MSLRVFAVLAAFHCLNVAATVFSPARFTVTSWDNPAGPAVRIYGASTNRVGIQEWESDGNPNSNPSTYKTWHSSPVLTSVVTAPNSDFAAINDNGQKIVVFYERDNRNGTTSLASAQWVFPAWTVGDFSVPSGSFKAGTRIAATMWASGRMSVVYQDASGLIYEKVNNGNGWGAASLFAFADQTTDLAMFGYLNNSTGVEKTFVYLQSQSQTYEYTWQSDIDAWEVAPVPGFTSGGTFGVTSFENFGTSRIYYISYGIGEFTGNPGAWQKLSNLGPPQNVGASSDIATTTQYIDGKWWTYVFYSATDGTLWQETFAWSGQNAAWTVPNQVVV